MLRVEEVRGCRLEMQPELRQLRYFLAVVDELNFTRAAAAASIGQQGLSAAIQRLETIVGVRLVDRDTHRVRLTPAGEAFAVEARRALAQVDRAVDAARRAHRGETGLVRIGYVPPAHFESLPRLVRRVGEAHPRLRLAPREMYAREIVAAVRAGEVELGLARWPPVVAGLRYETVRLDPLVAALPAAHPLAEAGELELARIGREGRLPLLTRPDSDGYNAAILAACRDAGFVPELLETPVMGNPALAPVAAGRAFALVSASSTHVPAQGIAYVPLVPAPEPVPLQAITGTEAPAAVGLVLDTLRRLAREEGWLVTT